MIQRPSRVAGSTPLPSHTSTNTATVGQKRSRSHKQHQPHQPHHHHGRSLLSSNDATTTTRRWLSQCVHSLRIRGLLRERRQKWKRAISIAVFTLVIVYLILQKFTVHHDRQYKMRLRHKPHDWSWWKRQQQHNNATNTKPWMVFYNIYMPEEVEGQEHAKRILQQQIGQVTNSYAATAGGSSISNPLHLFYNTIGSHSALTLAWMQQQGLSANMHMHFGKHYPQANEDATLQDIYDFCQVHADAQVIYLHSKGTFHYPKANETQSQKKFATQDRWRQIMTQAATHQSCLEESARRQCETCSLLMQPLPGIHYPGNMWTAQCRYIRKLKPALGFEYDMNQVVGLLARAETRDSLGVYFYPQMPHLMGRHRYAFEHWLGSHPQLRHPCHITTTPNMSEWLYEHVDIGTARKAPSFVFDDAWDFHHYHQTVATLHNETLRKRDYFLLAGQILRWIKLYKELPSSDSWVWTWFPDGSHFHDFVKQYDASFWASLDDDGILNILDQMARYSPSSGGGALRRTSGS